MRKHALTVLSRQQNNVSVICQTDLVPKQNYEYSTRFHDLLKMPVRLYCHVPPSETFQFYMPLKRLFLSLLIPATWRSCESFHTQ